MSARPDARHLREDVEALAAIVRDSAGAGERAAAAWVAGRMGDGGVKDVRVQPFRGERTYGWAHAAHAAAGLVAARAGGRAGALLALATLASLELDGSGRRPWLRRLLPTGKGANVIGRIPAAGERRATLVLVAHHDAAHTGLFWRVAERIPPHRRRIEPFMAGTAVGFGLVAAGAEWGRRLGGRPLAARRRGAAGRVPLPARALGAALLALSLAVNVDIATSPTVPGASDNATGVAAVLALARGLAAQPLGHVEVLVVSTGCEESGMAGMGAFLGEHDAELRPAPTFVLGLDTLGAGTPIACAVEGPILGHRYRREDLALLDEGARRAGLAAPERWRIGGWTDPILARFAGLPAVSLLSMGPAGIPAYHLPSDVPERVDWPCVERCLALAAGTVEAFAARRP